MNTDKIAEVLATLAEKLGTTSEYLWGVLVRQAQVSLVSDFIYYGIILLLILAATIGIPKLLKKAAALKEKSCMSDYYYIASATWGAITIIFFAIALGSIGGTVTKIMNPEYWALQEVLGVLK